MSSARHGWWYAFFLVIPFSSFARADAPAEEIAAQAQHIFRQHCGECHGTIQPRAGLSVLDRTSLVERHKVVAPGKPAASELLQLVETGTMPPGTRTKLSDEDRKVLRQWIEGGAVAFPREYGDAYVLNTILKDARQRASDPQSLAATRYFSLNHYLPDAEADLARAREMFFKALPYLSLKSSPPQPEALDYQQTIYRVDLRQLGWEETPFNDSAFNLYDLLLLEYPYAPLPERSEVWQALTEHYFKLAKPVRPIAYVQADWLVQAALRPPLNKDLGKDRVKSPPTGLENVVVREPQDLPSRRRILPLDGLTYPAHNVEQPGIQIALEAIDQETGQAATIFRPNGKLVVRLTNRGKKPIFFQLILASEGQKVFVAEEQPLEPGSIYRFPPDPKQVIPLDERPSRDHISVYASEAILPEGRLLHSDKKVTDRVVHDFYPLRLNAEPFDPSKLIKKTLEIETRVEKK